MPDATVSVRYAVATGMRLSCETTQKNESLAWETTIAPAPIASTVRTIPRSEPSPIEGRRGAMSADVVTSDTVDEP